MSNVSVARKFEERIADIIGGRRMSKQHYGHSTHDVESDLLIGECKLRKNLGPETWMQQVEEHWVSDKFCAVFAKQKGLKDGRTIVMMRLPDFMMLIKDRLEV